MKKTIAILGFSILSLFTQDYVAGAESNESDVQDDSLPHGEVVRLGTNRLRHPRCKAMTFLPHGKRIVSIDANHELRVWDVATGKEVRRFRGEGWFNGKWAISSSGRSLVTVGEDRLMHVWATATGQLRGKFVLNKNLKEILAVAFSSNDKKLSVLCGQSGNDVVVLDIASGGEVARRKLKEASSRVAFCPDGRHLAFVTLGTATVWNVGARKSRELRHSLNNNYQTPQRIKLSAGGKYLMLSTSYAPLVSVCDVTKGQEIARFRWRVRNYTAPPFTFLPDGKSFALAKPDGTVEIRQLADGKELRRVSTKLSGPRGICDMAVSPDGKTLLTRTFVGALQLWDLTTGKRLFRGEGHDWLVGGIALSHDGKRIATGSEVIYIWDRTTGKQLYRFCEPHGRCAALAFTKDDKKLLSVGREYPWHIATLFDVATGKALHHFGSADRICEFAVSNDATILAVTTRNDKHVYVWNVPAGKLLCKIDEGDVHGLALSSDNKTLALLAHDLILRDPTTGKLLRRRSLRSFIQEPDFLTWTRNGKMLVGCASAGVHFVEVLSGRERFLLPHPNEEVIYPAFALSPNGRLVARAVCENGVFQLYDVLRRRGMYIKGSLKAYGAMKFSQDNRYLATAMNDSSVLVWDVRKLVSR